MDFIKRADADAKRLVDQFPDYYANLDALYLGLIGFDFEEDAYEIISSGGEVIAFIRKVENNPGEISLARSLSPNTLFGAVGRYTRSITYELAVPLVDPDDIQVTVDAAYQLSSCLRIAGAAEGIIPAATRKSWSILGGIHDNSCEVHLFEDFPKARGFRKPSPINNEDIQWVGESLDKFSSLYEKNEAYKLAVQSYCSYGQANNIRLMAATIWSGIEALFNISAELRYRLSLYIGALTETLGEKRYEKFQKVKKLYDFRSKIVHGSTLDEASIANHIREVSLILAHLLTIFAQKGEVIEVEEIEKFLLFPEKLNLKITIPKKQ